MRKLSRSFNWTVGKGAIALILMAGALTACEGYQTEAEAPVVEPDVAVEEPAELAEETNVELGELTGNVEDYVGRSVSVRGDAEEAIGEVAFTLQDDQLFGGEEVVVFNATGVPFLLPEGEVTDQIQVTGEVRQLVLADLERDYGLDLDPELYAEYEERPALIAQSIALAPDPEEVSENPDIYYGQTIAVSGEIANQLAPDAYTIEEEQLFGGEEVLVVGANPEIPLDNAEEVVITGVLRPYVRAEFERDYDFTWDATLQDEIEAEYSEEPVLVAEEIYPGAQ